MYVQPAWLSILKHSKSVTLHQSVTQISIEFAKRLTYFSPKSRQWEFDFSSNLQAQPLNRTRYMALCLTVLLVPNIVCANSEGSAQSCISTVMFLSFRTDRSGQTVQTQLRLLLEKQSDLGLHCLPFWLHLLGALLFGKAILFKF